MRRGLTQRFLPRWVKESFRRQVAQSVETSPGCARQAAALAELEVRVRQLELTLQYEQRIPLPPPKHLQVRVIGTYIPEFVSSGYATFRQLSGLLAAQGKDWADFPTILDFGCGCGRIIRALRTMLPNHVLHGTDIDFEAIQWLQANCAALAEFRVNPHQPPMTYEDATFDLIYSISIFTHLPEAMQFAWLEELQRIAKPGAFLLLTTHGEKHFPNLPASAQQIMKEVGFCYLPNGNTPGLPDFYQVAYHSPAYIHRHWSQWFDILDIRPIGLDNHQDVVVMRKR